MFGQLVRSLMLWGFASFYGIIMLFQVVRTLMKHGYSKTFNKVKRERPACLQDPNLGTHGFLHLEDVKIHYVAKGPEDKPLMLFVHGFPEFWYSWRKQLLHFSQDYRCVAIDMRGYGESSKPSGKENYEMQHLMKDIQQVIGALGYKSCVLVAHDWGGAVAWAFGRLCPDYVDQLVIMNSPPSPIFRKILDKDKKQFKMSWYMFFFQLPFLPEILIGLKDFDQLDSMFGSKKTMANPIPKAEIDAYKYTFSQPGARTPPIDYYRAAFRGSQTVKYDMNFSVPVLLIWGMDDFALCDAIPALTEQEAPSIVVKRIENCGHFVQFDAPDKVCAIMTDWLASSKTNSNL